MRSKAKQVPCTCDANPDSVMTCKRHGNMEIIPRKQSTGMGSPNEFLVKRNGYPVGLLEKYPDDATESNPWKAYRIGGAPIGHFWKYQDALNAF